MDYNYVLSNQITTTTTPYAPASYGPMYTHATSTNHGLSHGYARCALIIDWETGWKETYSVTSDYVAVRQGSITLFLCNQLVESTVLVSGYPMEVCSFHACELIKNNDHYLTPLPPLMKTYDPIYPFNGNVTY